MQKAFYIKYQEAVGKQLQGSFESFLDQMLMTYKNNYTVAPEILKVVTLLEEWQGLVK